jgi:hypothetical protein
MIITLIATVAGLVTIVLIVELVGITKRQPPARLLKQLILKRVVSLVLKLCG